MFPKMFTVNITIMHISQAIETSQFVAYSELFSFEGEGYFVFI